MMRPTARLASFVILLVCVAGATALAGVQGEPVPPEQGPSQTLAPTRHAAQRYLPLVFQGSSEQIAPTPTVSARRPWPNTTTGIHVFNDQLNQGMSPEQIAFCASHYAGTQKMIRSEADRLRAINPDLLILHYRLGHGLGYRTIEGACQPLGDWIQIIEGDDWVREWPGADHVQEAWFYHWPESSQQRLLNCDWGWYLMDIANDDWRATWHATVLAQVRMNDSDGVFMDSLSVPNYLGHDRYSPPLPAIDAAFEAAWAQRIDAWLAWLQDQRLGDYNLVPNVGSWITTRNATQYLAADGLMVEGFAMEADASPYNLFDWRLQMDRMVRASKRGQALIGQSYATGPQERMFTLGCYLLIKGERTYLNIDAGLEPEWWPEYDLPVGAPQQPVTTIDDLAMEGNVIYGRLYEHARILVNPTSPWDGSGQTTTIHLNEPHYLAETSGGGSVPASGIPSGSVSYRAVTQVTLPPASAAVLFTTRP